MSTKTKPTSESVQSAQDAAIQAHPCPNCGYCPHCGRSNHPVRPWPVQPYPWYWQYPYGITCGGGNIAVGGYQNQAISASVN